MDFSAKSDSGASDTGKNAGQSGLTGEYDGFEDGLAAAARKRRKWTFETLKKESKKFKTRGEFIRGNTSAYNIALRKGHVDMWFPKTFRWTKENFTEELERHGNLKELKKKCPCAYSAGQKHGWTRDVDSKRRTHVPRGHWTLENAMRLATENRHMTAGEFSRSHSRAYFVLRKNHVVGTVGFKSSKPQAT